MAATGERDATEALRANRPEFSEESEADRARRFDRFEISLRADQSWWEIGRGRMGTTYRAIDTDSLASVALKLIHSAKGLGPAASNNLFQQAVEIAKLQHPNISRLVHFGTGADGRGFIVTEWVDGETLAHVVRRSGPLPVSLVLEAARQVTQSLEAAGERRIRHGNLNPAHLMLVDVPDEARPLFKVLDFGFMDWFRNFDPTGGELRATTGFASPETIGGRPPDERADFYSLGATLYFLLSARTPLISSDPHDPKSKLRVRFAPLREHGIPDEVIAWLRRLLDANPASRPKDAYELGESLAALRARLRKQRAATLPPPRSRTTRWWERWRGSRPG